MKRVFPFFTLILVSFISFAQSPSLGLVEIKATGLSIDNNTATAIVRFELEKTQKYQVIDEEEMKYKFVTKQHNTTDCFNPVCIIESGIVLGSQKMISGSVSKFGDNTLVILKLYDIESKKLETSKKIEVIKDENQTINEAIGAAIKEFHTNEDNFITVDISKKEEEKVVVQEKNESEATHEPRYYNYTDPQVYNQGLKEYLNNREKEIRYPKLAITTRPTTLFEPYTKVNLGVQYSFDNLTAIKASFGYLFESDNNNNFVYNNYEPGIVSGFEGRGEFMLRFPKDFYDSKSMYTRTYMSFEGAFKQKYHQGYQAYYYDPNIGNLQYDVPGITSRVMIGNIKLGMQYVFSNRIYLDMYMGVGIRIYRYQQTEYNNNYDYYYYYYYEDRVIPNFAAGFDFGILLK